MPEDRQLPQDTLNEIGVLKRREIEARILLPVVETLANEFGRERVVEIVRDVIVKVAREQGRGIAERMGDDSLPSFARALDDWQKGDAYRMDVLEQTDERFSFNVTRCRYAEMYRALGIPELGALLSCNRDFALVDGFNPDVKLTRTQTIMEGAPHCDFRFVRRRQTLNPSPSASPARRSAASCARPRRAAACCLIEPADDLGEPEVVARGREPVDDFRSVAEHALVAAELLERKVGDVLLDHPEPREVAA